MPTYIYKFTDRPTRLRAQRLLTPPEVAARHDLVVGLHATIPEDRRSAQSLGSEREGHGIVIDDDGLVVTIGYLITEAETIELSTADGKSFPATVIVPLVG